MGAPLHQPLSWVAGTLSGILRTSNSARTAWHDELVGLGLFCSRVPAYTRWTPGDVVLVHHDYFQTGQASTKKKSLDSLNGKIQSGIQSLPRELSLSEDGTLAYQASA